MHVNFRVKTNHFSSDHRHEKLLKSIIARFTRSIQEDVYIPLLPKSHVMDLKSDAGQFYLRQWNTALKLIRNILRFDQILSTEIIQEFIIIKIVNQHLLLKLDNLPKV